ncbi:MAG TPA: hypothetical protein VMS76_03085 [Planctomycetota bacterium]|nr:hypothetical protein [Planctomycetota bacterium]
MARVLLVHWNEGEARARAARLRAAGHRVDVHWDARAGECLREVRSDPPEAIVIDLGRLPSHGREVASSFRSAKATRSVPLVFVDGEQSKVERVRALLPDAVFTQWPSIRSALRRALAHPPSAPVVPGAMRSYEGTPLPKKLGIAAGSAAVLLGAPEGFESKLEPLPAGVRLLRRGKGARVLLFVRSRSELERRFPVATRALAPGGGLWIAWPKKTSELGSDLSQPAVRAFGLSQGFVDFKICAIDSTWSGLLFARRG